MATLEGHMTKLEAVNDMLWTIGESPVQDLESGLGDAAIAEAILDRTNRRIQLKGWHCNTRRNHELTTNSDNQFALPVDTLKVDTVNPTSGRQTDTPRHSAFINASMRRANDDNRWLLYDNDNNSETWTDVSTITVDIVQLISYANLTPALQNYVWTAAARQFQVGAMGSKVLYEITSQDLIDAETQAVQEDSENEDLNVIRENPHVRSVAYRFNPHFNR
jgi:hypothetical protein